ncbi:sodium/glutamate symporter [Chitinolyticbacter albus]|uniref:sodium/glutamate symporter n=1 Tax=Chitinolyticbacter albus TaxID=2961951 RepID=UPI0021086515|nr:sodium/glutamate symporter [Chitinolyticbacter albus]
MTLDAYATFVAASLVLLLGRRLVAATPPLRTYSIPEPVAGGLIVALSLLALRQWGGVVVEFDTGMQGTLMLAFFATIGLSANLALLVQGGRALGLFLAVVVGLLLVQNTIGVALATLLGLDPLIGLIAGSITLSGGHGTGAAWGAVFSERYGLTGATELALACATFGLVLGGLIGGPVARHLVKRTRGPEAVLSAEEAPTGFEQPDAVRLITAPAMIETLALIAVSLSVGKALADLLHGSPLELPAFVCVLFVGVLLRNGLQALGWYSVFDRAVSVVGNVALSLFLAMALMSLRLWELAELALPMLVLLTAQAAAMAAYAIWITFRAMGSNYDAAVLAAGHCGFGLGATPTAIANMQAITEHFGPSHLAFMLVPIVGAFFIDIANAVVIKLFLAVVG